MGIVRLTVVPNVYEAEIVSGLLRTEGITSEQRPTNLAVGMMDGMSGGGPLEIVVREEDFERAHELLEASRNA
jgi:Putative prokaryotic signal transducing protein